VNNAGIFFAKRSPITRWRTSGVVVDQLYGFIHTTQLAVKQMLSQKSGGSVVSITTSIVDHPLGGVDRVLPDDHQGRYRRDIPESRDGIRAAGIRVNVVAPGVVDTRFTRTIPRSSAHTVTPRADFGRQGHRRGCVLSHRGEPGHREVLHVDGGAHLGRW